MKVLLFAAILGINSYAMASALKCIYAKSDIVVYYDYSTKFIYKKNAPNLPTKPIMSPENLCMSDLKGPVVIHSSVVNGDERSQYSATLQDASGYETKFYGNFAKTGNDTAYFTCNSPTLWKLDFPLTSCYDVETIE